MEITIATWWVEDCTDTADPQSVPMRLRWDDRRAMEERYNFRIRYVRYSDWEGTRDMMQTELLAQNRDYTIWAMEPGWFATHHAQGLFAPIPLEYFTDDVQWRRSVLDATMRDGAPHAFSSEANLFSAGIYWNMRLFEEAGLPRDLPFTLQREGNWTWETFTDIARELHRDLTGDGFPDTWPIVSFSTNFLRYALASNGANYVTIDPVTGQFVNATNTPEFLETILWVNSLRQEMLTLHEEDVGGEWNVYIQMFNNGMGAMRAGGHYVAASTINPNLADDFGFVAFPRGPRATSHYSWVAGNFHAIPHFFSPEEVDDIMFAFSMWNRILPDADDYDWIFENLVNHRDERSVEETMLYFTRNSELQSMPVHALMPGLGNILGTNFEWRVWSPMNPEPAVIIEEGQQPWEAFIERVNDMLN
jgi:ABC-type glycerol-3-phosphate transport system substrate-binding protein